MAPRQPIISRTDSHDTSRSSTQSTQSFDSHSISMAPSEPTSDERPDLGAAFSTVIRELAYMMQPPLREVVMRHNAQMRDDTTEDSEEGQTHDSYTYTPSAFERARRAGNSADMQEEEANNSTVWDNRRIASYLASHTPSFTPSQTEPEYMAGDVSSYPHSTPRTILQSAFLAKHSSPIRESFTPADDHDAYSSPFPHQAYEHHDYHSSISTGPSPQGSSGEAYFRDDSETVPIASSIDSGVLSRTEDEDEYSEDEEAQEQRRHTAALRHIVRSGGLDLVREESTEGGVRHEVIRPLILREDSSASDLVLPIEYSGHTKQGSGASGVSSSGSTLSSRNNTLSGSLTISGNGTLHFPNPRRPYTPPAYREGHTSGGNEGGFYRAYNDLNSVNYAPDSTVDELVDEYRQVDGGGESTSFDPDGSFDDNVEYPPESESQSEEDLEYVEERDSLVDDVSSGRPNGNVYIGGRDSVMARSLPNLGRGGPDEDEPNEHPQIIGDVKKRSPHVSLVHTSPNPNPSLGYLDAALAYLAAEREKVTKGRSTGVGKDAPLDAGASKGKEKQREHFDDLVDDDENIRQQDFRNGGENVRGYGIFGPRDRDDDDDDDAGSTKANVKGKSKDKGKGNKDERSPKGKKSSKILVPRILKRPAIPFPTAVSATSLEEPDEKLDLDATPVMASAPFFSEPVTPSGRRLLAHSRVETLHSAPVPAATASDQEHSTLSSDADESSGLGGDDADDDFHTTGTEGFGSHSDRIPIHRAKSAEGYDRGALEGPSWQQRLLNEHKSRQENKRSRKSSQVRSGGRNSEQVPIKDFVAQRDSHFPDAPGTTFPNNGLNIRDGQQGTNPPKGSKVAKKANHKRHSSDFGRPGNAGKRSLLHARSSPLLRPSEILAGSDPSHSGGASEGQTRPKPQSQPAANLDKFDVHGGAGLSDADARRIAQLRVLGQKLRKAFPEDVKSLDQVAILGARKGGKSSTDSRGSGKESTIGSGRDSDRFGQREELGERGSRKRKRSRTRTRRRKIGDAKSVDDVEGVDDADDAGDEEEEEEIIWDGGFIDTRGPLPNANDPPVHIFIDQTREANCKESALRLGYEVHIFKRVPHDDPPANAATDGSDRQPNGVSVQKDKGHRRQISGSTSTESDQANFSRGFLRNNGGGKPRLLTNNSAPVSSSSPSSFAGNRSSLQPQKIRYREQGVDELLQLKLSQVLLRTEAPVPGSTIVLATGDGNAGQFNEEGFVEPVRIALQRGWKVELYAWEDGLSRTWRREFGDSSRASGKKGASKGKGGDEDSSELHTDDKGYGDRFRIIGMEKFGGELVEADGWDLGTVPSLITTD
ncbi:hypothetical protein PLEOSDRAFT_1098109 [Pleurotus ostreatus PC15]|uniref:Uncharacterized protein n=1 Tax=Pleurotus ostreatus (strain PC15) TaxID=1137138 RepID=A0A067N828_PLEO1|nr:hypothetical protein PLEOSDRAFT_1098109 [Pleurotus ostreatus PC15]